MSLLKDLLRQKQNEKTKYTFNEKENKSEIVDAEPKKQPVIEFAVAAMIAKNMGDEAGAIEGYYELLTIVDEEDVDTIKEIISDELNHSDKLKAMLAKYTKIKPAKG